jgi:hypothetical protein
MIINLSNHPSANWTTEQLIVAKTFGEIVDLPFPNTSLNGDETYMQVIQRT